MLRKLIKGGDQKGHEPKEHVLTPTSPTPNIVTPDEGALTSTTNLFSNVFSTSPRPQTKQLPSSTPLGPRHQTSKQPLSGSQIHPNDEQTREEDSGTVDERANGTKSVQRHLIDNEAIALAAEPWYHGLMPRGEMKDLLTQEGDFLVRKTEVGRSERFALSIFWRDRVIHILIRPTPQGRWSIANLEVETIAKLVSFYMRSKAELLPDGPKLLKYVERPKWYILHENVQLKQKIGSGSFGDVFLAELMQTDGKKADVAVKMLKGKMGKKERTQFVKEASLNRRFKHPNVLRLLGVASQVEPVMVVSELANGGSLRSHCRNNPNLSIHQLTKYLYEAAKGLEYLESMGVIHRDVAARNCLLTADEQIKVSDFGMSVAHTEVKETKVMMWEVYTRCRSDPYPGMTNAEARKAIVNGQKLKAPAEEPIFAVEIMEKCWITETKDRVSFKEVVRALGVGMSEFTTQPQEESCY